MRKAVTGHVIRLLREAREKQRMSMIVLAQRSGLSQSMVSLVERELRNPSLDTLLRMTEALEIDLGDVLKKAKSAALANK